MKYTEFRKAIIDGLRRQSRGLTWRELKEKLALPYKTPCPTWIKRMEDEDGLVRQKGAGRALVWSIPS